MYMYASAKTYRLSAPVVATALSTVGGRRESESRVTPAAVAATATSVSSATTPWCSPPAAIRTLLGDTPPKGVFFAALLLLVIGTCVVIILRHERSHPDAGAQLSPQAVVAGEDMVERSTRKLDASPPRTATPGNGVPGPMKQISPTIVALQRASTQPKLEQSAPTARLL